MGRVLEKIHDRNGTKGKFSIPWKVRISILGRGEGSTLVNSLIKAR